MLLCAAIVPCNGWKTLKSVPVILLCPTIDPCNVCATVSSALLIAETAVMFPASA